MLRKTTPTKTKYKDLFPSSPPPWTRPGLEGFTEQSRTLIANRATPLEQHHRALVAGGADSHPWRGRLRSRPTRRHTTRPGGLDSSHQCNGQQQPNATPARASPRGVPRHSGRAQKGDQQGDRVCSSHWTDPLTVCLHDDDMDDGRSDHFDNPG
jgi:hypothetical protein